MKLYNIFFVTFNLIFLRLCSSESSNDDLPIETVYPKCYNNKDKPSGIMVHKEFFDPIHGYAITPFKDNEVNRNNFRPRKPYDEIKIIVLHFTGDSFANTINRFYLRNTHYPSSAHYLITRPTEAEAHKQLLQVVTENCVAYHSGISVWSNHHLINAMSLGIEIVNSGNASGSWEPFAPEQIHIVGTLVTQLARKYNVEPYLVVGHSDVAPSREVDPGVMFPWGQLYKEYNIGGWLDDEEMVEAVIMARYDPPTPCPRAPDQKLFIQYIHNFGFHVSNVKKTIRSFKAHFSANQKPHMYAGRLTQHDMYWAWALSAKYPHPHPPHNMWKK